VGEKSEPSGPKKMAVNPIVAELSKKARKPISPYLRAKTISRCQRLVYTSDFGVRFLTNDVVHALLTLEGGSKVSSTTLRSEATESAPLGQPPASLTNIGLAR
jgi:hypothetical protein